MQIKRNIHVNNSIFICVFFFIEYCRTNATIDENRQEIMHDSFAYCILMLLATLWQFIFGVFCVDCFNRTAIRQVTRIRVKYFESLMRQDIAWYDCSGNKTNFTIRITEYVLNPFNSSVDYKISCAIRCKQ